ncbi:MAG: HAMP domain-containing protein [Nitrospirae bacterium]|nr:HAMP domain-containing protein [Nitrospirota bacterium]
MRINRKLIILFLFISLLPLSLTIFMTFFIAKKSLTAQILKRLDSLATIQKHRIENILENNQERLSIFASRTQMRLILKNFHTNPDKDYLKTLNRILEDAIVSIRDCENISILSTGGKVLASTNYSLIGKDLSNEEYFKGRLLKNNVDIFVLDEVQNLRMYLSSPLYLEGELIGVVVVKSTANKLLSLVKDYTGLGETGETIIARQDERGNALFLTPLRYDPKAALKRTVKKDNIEDPIIQALNRKERLYTDAVAYHGEHVLASTRYIKEAGIGLAVIVHQYEAFAAIKRLRNIFVILLLTSSIVIIIVLSKMSKVVAQPINKLSHIAHMINEGDLSQRSDIVSKDEIGDLAKYFNKMTDTLVREITERKSTERELVYLNMNLEKRVAEEVEKNRQKDQIAFEQSRQIAMGDLLVNIAHHWRQPLNAVGMLAQNIRDAFNFNELSKELLDRSVNMIMDELLSLSNMLNGFKEIYYIRKEKEIIDFSGLIKNILDLLKNYLSFTNATIDTEIQKGIEAVGYTSIISQVIISILTNSLDTFVERKVADGSIKIRVTKESDGNKTLIVISDSGGGIEEEILENIFDPYFTTKFKERGRGLSLYMSKTMIEMAMGGRLAVRNTIKGAEFIIEI